MVLITHAIVGAGVAQLFPEYPAVGFVAGILSHYLSDFFPHWDYAQYFSSVQKKSNGRLEVLDRINIGPKFILESLLVLLDAVLGLALAWFLWKSPLIEVLVVVLGAIGGMLPDFLQIAYGFFKNKFTQAFQKIHAFTHTPEKWKIRDWKTGVIAQALFLILFVAAIKLIS